jgi:signal transduction histidine kinase
MGSRVRRAARRSVRALAHRPVVFAAVATPLLLGMLALTELQRSAGAIIGPGRRTMIETTVCLAFASAAATFFRRWRERHLLHDLIALHGCVLVVVAAAVSGMGDDLAAVLGHAGPHWTAFTARTLGAVVLVVAAVQACRPIPRPVELSTRTAGLSLAALPLGAVLPFVAWGAGLPPIDPGAAGAARVFVAGNLLVVPLLVVGARRSLLAGSEGRDGLLVWLGLVLLLLAASRVSLSWDPIVHPDVLHLGDVVRLAAAAALALGCAGERHDHARMETMAAVVRERQQLARDLHDGLAQELALLTAQSRWIAKRSADGQGIELIASTAQRALDESRSAISELRSPLGEPLGVALGRVAAAAGRRTGTTAEIRVATDIEVSEIERRELVRLVREVVARAGTREVCIRVSEGPEGIKVEAQPRGQAIAEPAGEAGTTVRQPSPLPREAGA